LKESRRSSTKIDVVEAQTARTTASCSGQTDADDGVNTRKRQKEMAQRQGTHEEAHQVKGEVGEAGEKTTATKSSPDFCGKMMTAWPVALPSGGYGDGRDGEFRWLL
jgi:hypothetical protein